MSRPRNWIVDRSALALRAAVRQRSAGLVSGESPDASVRAALLFAADRHEPGRPGQIYKMETGCRGCSVILAAAVVMFLGVRKQFHEGRFQPEEDMSGAVRYLRKNVAPSDLVLVHPSLREGFLLYTRDSRLDRAARDLRRHRMALLPARQAARRGCLDAGEDPARSGRQNPARFSRPDLAVLYRPSDALGLCSRRGFQALAKLLLEPQLPCPKLYIRFANLGLTPMRCAARWRQLPLRIFLPSSHLLSWFGFP